MKIIICELCTIEKFCWNHFGRFTLKYAQNKHKNKSQSIRFLPVTITDVIDVLLI